MAAGASSGNYAGDILPTEAWELLRSHPDAQLIDVRTMPEWAFVGLPDLSSQQRSTHRISWQLFPQMNVNPSFVEEVKQAVAGAKPDTLLFFLCRSGARSRSAAIAMTEAGFTRAYNIAGGFEGDMDSERHRGGTNGWKAADLPWSQT